MYTVTYFQGKREMSASAASWSKAMDKASMVAIKQSLPPFPIVIKQDGIIVHTIHG